MNNLLMGVIEILLKQLEDGKLFKYIEEYVLILWEKDIENVEKKKLVIEKASAIWATVAPALISFIIKFVVTQVRLKAEAEAARNGGIQNG